MGALNGKRAATFFVAEANKLFQAARGRTFEYSDTDHAIELARRLSLKKYDRAELRAAADEARGGVSAANVAVPAANVGSCRRPATSA